VPAFKEVEKRQQWLVRARPIPWAAMLVSEQTRQFHAYKDIAERHLPHVFGVFRAASEEHLPLNLINDWDLEPVAREKLARYKVLVLPNAAALSDAQVDTVREFVKTGGGLVATCETSLFDEIGGPRKDFALADVFGVNYKGHPANPTARPQLDANFAVVADEQYWKQRSGVARLTWAEHPLVKDEKLADLVPRRDVIFRGPQVLVSEPADAGAVAVRLAPEGTPAGTPPAPAVIVRGFGQGRVVYFAAGIDAALWSYSFPYQRRLMARAIELAAGGSPPVRVVAPMCVQSTFFEQSDAKGRRTVVHLFNGLDTAAGHGLPRSEVPLREETVPVHDIRVKFSGAAPKRVHIEPAGVDAETTRSSDSTEVTVPPLEVHCMVVAEW
jgi:type 1 glutamine amidotransferase